MIDYSVQKRKNRDDDDDSRKKFKKGYGSSEKGLINLLPDDILIRIIHFLNVYDQVGLGTVSSRFNNIVKSYFGYEPIPYDPENPDSRLWARMGMQIENLDISEKRSGELDILAAKAFGYITTNIEEVSKRKPSTGVACKVLAKISSEVQQNSKSFIAVNCVATLEADGKRVFAVNFQVKGSYQEILNKLSELGIDEAQIKYQLVTHRHAECRLILKLAYKNLGEVKLKIDKLCCVFCAAQFCALGYHSLMPGWKKGKLGWYTFLPSVMFFNDNRVKLWGDEIDSTYNSLTWDERLHFLYLLVCQTQKEDQVQILPLQNIGGSGGMVVEPPKCKKCGTTMKWKKGSNGDFWGCPNWNRDDHKQKVQNEKVQNQNNIQFKGGGNIGRALVVQRPMCKICNSVLEEKEGKFGKFLACRNWWRTDHKKK